MLKHDRLFPTSAPVLHQLLSSLRGLSGSPSSLPVPLSILLLSICFPLPMAGIQAWQQSSQDALRRCAGHGDAGGPGGHAFHFPETPEYSAQDDSLLDQYGTEVGYVGLGGGSRSICLAEGGGTEYGGFRMGGWICSRVGKRRGENREHEGIKKN